MPRDTKPATTGADLALPIDAIPMPVAAMDGRHRLVAANAAFRDVVGEPEPLGRSLRAVLNAAGASGVDTGLGGVFRIARPGGPERSFQLTVRSQGARKLAFLTEVADARVSLEQLRMAEEARAKLMHDAEVGLWRYDPDADLYYFSSELSLGYGDIGAPVPTAALQQIQHPDDRAQDTEIRERITREGGQAEAEMRYLANDGSWTHLRVLYRAGKPTPTGRFVLYGVSLSITALARARDEASAARQAAEAATSAKSDFLASVSHEIRTPMNGIVGVLNLLKQERLTEAGRRLLDEALGCTGMLSQLINDVLDFSKIEAGRLELNPEPASPAAIAESVVSLLQPQAEAKGLTLTCVSKADLGWAEIDAVRLRQCLFNVVGNAVKFTEVGSVKVRMSIVGEGEPDARRLRCEVQDTGIGVPESARARLFDRFQQVDGGATRRFGGTGLGLAISRQLARMMGGDLDFWSREGSGSTFWFEIAAPWVAAPDAADTDEGGAEPLLGLTVLVVDDNRVNRLVAAKSLEAMGASAEAAESGPAAIEAATARAFDLILMDINMPGMDGLEAARRIRALGPRAAATPIVALTADVMRHQYETYIAAGMDGVVPKPFSPGQLLAEVMRLAATDREPASANVAAG